MRDLVKSLAWAIAFTIVHWTSMESLYKGICKSLCKRWTSFSILEGRTHVGKNAKKKEIIEDSFSRMLFVPLDVIWPHKSDISSKIMCSTYFKWFTDLWEIFFILCERIFFSFICRKKSFIFYCKINIRQTF